MHRRDALERLIDDFDGAVLMVSHDRHLLDECVSSIAELDRGTVRIWPGAYSAYTVARRLELERQQQWLTQRKEIARLEEAIRRFRLGAHHRRQAPRHAGAREADADRQDGEGRAAGCSSGARWRSSCAAPRRGGQRVLALEQTDFAFGEDPVLLDVELVITRGERVGVVGPNGAGRPCSRACWPASSSRAPARAGSGRASRSATSPRRRATCPATAR